MPGDSAATPPAVERVVLAFTSGKGGGLDAALSEEVELRPPTYGKSWRGRVLVGRLLDFAADALGGLTYTAAWRDGPRHVLRFEGTIGGEPISGVDVITLDDDERIECFEIFARPPRAIERLRDAMGERVEQDSEVASMMGLTSNGER